MNQTTAVPVTAMFLAILAGGLFLLPTQTGQNNASATESMQTARGSIGSVQLDAAGNAGWVQTGIWVIRMSPPSTGSEQPTVNLIARFVMVKPDGTAMHVHKIYNFSAAEMSEEGNSTTVVNGTATVTMSSGPVSGVPVTIKVSNNAVIGFWIGPEKVDAHFGSTPVYGTVSTNSQEVMKDIRTLMQGMDGSQIPAPSNNNNNNNNNTTTNTISLNATEVDEVYRWASDEGINPSLKLVANANNVIRIQNPTDEEHELVFEANGEEVATSGDIEPNESGELAYTPEMTGTFEYHCEYHPDTMKGTFEVAAAP
ncbi:MAG TPA: cupredoxin domain-containing protein [Nitrososphaera sp.]|nr:cupredoxin domain-containing protein [Nitrososphaera sp.]